MTDIKLSVAIFSHPSRETRLKQTLGLLMDENIKIIIDTESKGIWNTAMSAWRSYDSDATHHMVLQDDIIPCKNFLNSVPSIISNLPPYASVSFCDNLRMMRYAKSKGIHWVKSQIVRHAQALVQPVSQIEEWIRWSEWNVRPEYYHDDGRLEMYLVKHHKHIWHTCPSLVSHDDDGSVYRKIMTGESKPEDKPPYKEFDFIGDDVDPLSLDWNTDKFVKQGRRLRFIERWAVGEIEIPIDGFDTDRYHRILNEKSLSVSYEDAIHQARIDRGLI